MKNLYDLASEFQFLQNTEFESPEGEVAVSLYDQLAAIEMAFDRKALAVVRVVKNLSAESEMIDVEVKRLSDRKRALANRVDGLKSYLEQALAMAGQDKVKDELFSVTRQKSPLSVSITDDAAVPDDFAEVRTQRVIDKRAIIAAIKATGEIPEWAEVVQAWHVVIR